MNKHDVRNPEQALAYLVDCTLATVCDLASKKSRPKGEFDRQVNIAQAGIGWLRDFGADISTTRAHDVVTSFGGSVAKWSAQYFPKA